MGYEGRTRSCWGCKFFIQIEEEYRNGVCVRHAPAKIDENLGEPTQNTDPDYAVFANVLDSENGFCGEHVPALIAPPSVIPAQKPGEAV